MSFKLTGVNKMQTVIKRIQNKLNKDFDDVMAKEAKAILKDSKDNFVPIDSGDLKRTGRVGKVKTIQKEKVVDIRFGGPKAPYSLVIHEWPNVQGPPTWQGKKIHFKTPGRGPKYLQKPLFKAIAGMNKRMAEGLKL